MDLNSQIYHTYNRNIVQVPGICAPSGTVELYLTEAAFPLAFSITPLPSKGLRVPLLAVWTNTVTANVLDASVAKSLMGRFSVPG